MPPGRCCAICGLRSLELRDLWQAGARRVKSARSVLPERRRFAELFDLLSHGGALMLEEIRDRPPQLRIHDLVRRIGGGRQIAAGDLVLTLRARLDPGELVLDGVLDRLIIADLEMQERMLLDGAPVAAEQRA